MNISQTHPAVKAPGLTCEHLEGVATRRCARTPEQAAVVLLKGIELGGGQALSGPAGLWEHPLGGQVPQLRGRGGPSADCSRARGYSSWWGARLYPLACRRIMFSSLTLISSCPLDISSCPLDIWSSRWETVCCPVRAFARSQGREDTLVCNCCPYQHNHGRDKKTSSSAPSRRDDTPAAWRDAVVAGG